MKQIFVPTTPPQLVDHGSGRFKPTPVGGGGGGGEFNPIMFPLSARINGDSNTAGRSSSTLPAVAPHIMLRDILVASGYTEYSVYSMSDLESLGGRSLAGTMTVAQANVGQPGAWIHVEESGGQDNTGQYTPLEFGDTFEAGWRAIHALNPTSIKSAANAPNFGRDPFMRYRDWQFRNQWSEWGYASEAAAISYNEEMLRRIDILALDGIDIIPIFIAERGDELGALLPSVNDLYSDTNLYHWSAVGRLIQVLETFRCFGWDVNTLNLSTVTVHIDPTTDAAWKALCVQVINNVGA